MLRCVKEIFAAMRRSVCGREAATGAGAARPSRFGVLDAVPTAASVVRFADVAWTRR